MLLSVIDEAAVRSGLASASSAYSALSRPGVGPSAMFGLGGIFVEVMKDMVFQSCHFGEDVAGRMIRSIKGASLLWMTRDRVRRRMAAFRRHHGQAG